MAKPLIDITVLGDKQLEKALAAMPAALQKKAVRPALREQAKRERGYIIENLSGKKVSPDTGAWLAGMKHAKIRALKRSRTMMGYRVSYPTREELGIGPTDKYFYPAAVEYGHTGNRGTVQAFRVVRDAVDEHARGDFPKIARRIRRGVVEQKRKAKMQ